MSTTEATTPDGADADGWTAPPVGRPSLRIPGHDLDHVDVRAGLAMLLQTGYNEARTVMVVEHALARWARGEEDAAERGAIDTSFHGIDLTSWRMVLAAARAGGERKAAAEAAYTPRHATGAGGTHDLADEAHEGATAGQAPAGGNDG